MTFRLQDVGSVKHSPKEKATLDRLIAVYESATAEDKAEALGLVERAKVGTKEAIVVTLKPAVAAILFFDHNRQNREWSYLTSENYARQMSGPDWHFTGQGISFLVSGNLGDGQHRCAGVALAGQPITVVITFGMVDDGIIALDSQGRRQPSDFLQIVRGQTDTKRIQSVVKRGFHYLASTAENEEAARPYRLTNTPEIVRAVDANHAMITDALAIADESVRGRSKPTMSAGDAAGLVFVLLMSGWPKAKVTADLDVLQSGIDREGSNSPLFVAADQLAKDAAKREPSSVTSRYGMCVRAFQLWENGARAVRAADIRNAGKKKTLPKPTYPATQQAAE